MSGRSRELLDQGLDFFTAIVTRLGEDSWGRPTPCADWTVLNLLGHRVTTVRVAISVMQGEQPTWPEVARPGDLVEGDPVEFWRGTVVQARDVLRDADLAREMDTPLGRTVADDLSIPVIDLYVHAWDLGAVAGIPVEIPADVIDYAHAYIDPLPVDAIRGDGRAFGPQTRASLAQHRPNASSPGADASYRDERARGRRPPGAACARPEGTTAYGQDRGQRVSSAWTGSSRTRAGPSQGRPPPGRLASAPVPRVIS
jgi:uncharacterized protein (TIGR03086 family)